MATAMGSEFVVRLPVVLSLAGPHRDKDGEGDGATARRRVLVVDDNRDAAISLAMMLRMMGNETQTAHDGQEALDVATAFRPDVILLDIGMPKLNGYDAARRIRQEAWGKNAVLVAVTGWGQDDDRRRSRESGFNFHMVKPIEPATLEKLLAGLQATTRVNVRLAASRRRAQTALAYGSRLNEKEDVHSFPVEGGSGIWKSWPLPEPVPPRSGVVRGRGGLAGTSGSSSGSSGATSGSFGWAAFSDSEIRLCVGSTLSTFTCTSCPICTMSPTRNTRCGASSEIWISPSMAGSSSTKAPKSISRDTLPETIAPA